MNRLISISGNLPHAPIQPQHSSMAKRPHRVHVMLKLYIALIQATLVVNAASPIATWKPESPEAISQGASGGNVVHDPTDDSLELHSMKSKEHSGHHRGHHRHSEHSSKHNEREDCCVNDYYWDCELPPWFSKAGLPTDYKKCCLAYQGKPACMCIKEHKTCRTSHIEEAGADDFVATMNAAGLHILGANMKNSTA
jgi:hypothetical protein